MPAVAGVERPLHFEGAVRLASAIRAGQLRSRDLLETYIERIGRFDPAINAVVARRFDKARAEADAADRSLAAGIPPGPLHGLPVTVKESFDVTGLATTWGLPKFKSNIADGDAIAVERLRRAGAIVFGKTNVPRLLADWQTYNEVYGTTNNPWALDRSPGGSSGGSAAALAAGLTALDLGSDIASSIRNPAHYCGVFGHKCTWGIASSHRQAPPGVVAVPDLAVIGPLARNAKDLALALDVIAGPDSIDGAAWTLTLPTPRVSSAAGLRVAILADHPIAPIDADVATAVRAVADHLSDQGAIISNRAWPDVEPEEIYRLYIQLLRATTSRNNSRAEVERFAEETAGLVSGDMRYWSLARRGLSLRHRDWLALNELRHRYRLKWAAFFEKWDALICPVAVSGAMLHDHSEPRHERMIAIGGADVPSTNQIFWAGLAIICHLPATAFPVNLSRAGLPIGLQIIGPQYGDRTTIAIAGLLERGFGGFQAPPGY